MRLYLDVLVSQGALRDGALARSLVVRLDMDQTRRTCRHVLRLEHLLLKVLAVAELALFDGEAKAWVLIVAH